MDKILKILKTIDPVLSAVNTNNADKIFDLLKTLVTLHVVSLYTMMIVKCGSKYLVSEREGNDQ
jgi:hypothetical protein